MVEHSKAAAVVRSAALAVDPHLLPVYGFDAACEMVLDYLSAAAPMGLWAVSRITEDEQLMLKVRASSYQIESGTEFNFDSSFYRMLLLGQASQVAADVAVGDSFYAASVSAAAQGFPFGAYAGTPIVRPGGELFGTVCAFSPTPHDAAALVAVQPLLKVFSSLLSAVLASETAAEGAAREAEMRRLDADVDALTGLLNRRGWDRYVAHEEHRQRRFGDPASVIVLDLDRLKDVNDRLGHAAGDAYIQAAADALRINVRAADVVARLGGDEFAVLALGVNADGAAALVERMNQAVELAGVVGSFGSAPYLIVAGFPGALAAADTAMYRAKRQRRSGYGD